MRLESEALEWLHNTPLEPTSFAGGSAAKPLYALVPGRLMADYDWYCDDVFSGKLEVDRVYEDDLVLAFHHPRPMKEIHVVAVPKAHVPSLLSQEAVDGKLLESMMLAVQAAARATGLDKTGFTMDANAVAPGVTQHMHWHILGPGVG